MSGFFDDSHVTDIGLRGSLGPSVGFTDMVEQGYRQQYRIDSQMALDTELENRWLESVRALEIAGGSKFKRPLDPMTYRGFAQYISGKPVTVFPFGYEGEMSDAGTNPFVMAGDVPIPKKVVKDTNPLDNLQEMIRINEEIKKLNNPSVKSFEAILEEVAQMQHEVEGESTSMYERTGTLGVLGNLLGAIGGSFTTRDPLNIITAPIGAGRTIATRIAVDMGIAAGVVSATEFGDVAPNRALVGLPERNPLYNIVAATLGAGIIRGGLEGIGAGVRSFRDRTSPDVDFDLRDSQLAEMFGANVTNPQARAGAHAISDASFVERNNPYGDGPAAQERFLAELRQVQRVMGGEPMTAVARVLPPMPFEYVEKLGNFHFVREQAPEVYARMEAAQAKLASVTQELTELTSKPKLDLISSVRLVDQEAAEKLTQLSARVNDPNLPEPARIAADIEAQTIVRRVGQDKIVRAVEDVERADKFTVRNLRASRRAANKEYRTAYRAVEDEATRLRAKQDAIEAEQQRQGVSIFADATYGRPFNWSILQYDNVSARVDAINATSDIIDERAASMFARQTEGEGEEAVARETWRTDEGIDIGLKQPVDPDFRFATDDGELTVGAAMRDLQDDADLEEAMRTCLR